MVFVMVSAAYLQLGTLMSKDRTHIQVRASLSKGLFVGLLLSAQMQGSAVTGGSLSTKQHTLSPPVAGVSHSLFRFVLITFFAGGMPGTVWQAWCDTTSITNSDAEDGKDAQVWS